MVSTVPFIAGIFRLSSTLKEAQTACALMDVVDLGEPEKRLRHHSEIYFAHAPVATCGTALLGSWFSL